MVQRTHLGYQEEGVVEKGLQIRTSDPISPVEDQTWYNKTEQRIKTYKGGNVLVLVEGIAEAMEIPLSTIADLLQSRSFYKNISANYAFDFANFNTGMFCTVKFENSSIAQNQVTSYTFPSATTIDDGDYFVLYSASNLIKYYTWFDLNGLNISDPNVSGATAIRVPFTKGLVETTEFTCPAGASITSGQYFLLYSGGDATAYYVWFNVDGLGGDPLVPAKTGVQVAILSTDTNAQVATKLASALDALADFTASALSNVVTNSTVTQFVTTDASNVSVGGIFAVNVTQQGVQADSAVSIAQKVRAEIDALADFSAPNPVTPTLVVTNATDGFTDDPEVGTMPVGFSFVINTVGSGTVIITFPSGCILDVNTDDFVPASGIKLYYFLKIGNDIFVNGKEY